MDTTFPDLGSLTDQELKELIKELTEKEMEISYERRILHGKIDILRAELVNRLRKKGESGEGVPVGRGGAPPLPPASSAKPPARRFWRATPPPGCCLEMRACGRTAMIFYGPDNLATVST